VSVRAPSVGAYTQHTVARDDRFWPPICGSKRELKPPEDVEGGLLHHGPMADDERVGVI